MQRTQLYLCEMRLSCFFSFVNLFICFVNALPHVSSDENDSMSLHPTIQALYDTKSTISPNESLYPTPSKIELSNPPPTLLYPDKLPKFIQQKDDKHKNKKKRKKRKKKHRKKNRKSKLGKNKNQIDKKNKKEKHEIEREVENFEEYEYGKKRVIQNNKESKKKENQ